MPPVQCCTRLPIPSALRLSCLSKVSLCPVFANETRPGTTRDDASDCLYEKLVSFLNARVSTVRVASSQASLNLCVHASADAQLQKRTHPAIAIDTAHCTKEISQRKKRCFQKPEAGLAKGGRGSAPPRRLCDCNHPLHGWERRVLGPGRGC